MTKYLFLFVAGSIGIQAGSFAQSYLPEKRDEAMKVKPVIPLKAYAFNLKDVRLLEGSPFKHAMDMDAGLFAVVESGQAAEQIL